MPRGPAKQFDPDEALDAAMTVFRARGYEAAGVTELLAAMGIGRKSLYDTFGSKRGLFLEAVRRYGAREADALEATLSAPGSPLANVRAAVEAVARAHGCAGAVGCGIGNSVADFTEADPEASATLAALAEANRERWAAALRRARDAGELPPHADPDDLARTLQCLTQGMALLGRVSGPMLAGAARGLTSLLGAPPD